MDKWSADKAARRLCDALCATHQIEISTDARRLIAAAMNEYYGYYRDRQRIIDGVAARRQGLATAIKLAADALTKHNCNGSCELAFGIPQNELRERLLDLHDRVEHDLYMTESMYERPAHRPSMKLADRLIMSLAAAFTDENRQALEAHLTKGQVGLHPAFVELLERCHDALPSGAKPCSSKHAFVRRAKERRSEIANGGLPSLGFLF